MKRKKRQNQKSVLPAFAQAVARSRRFVGRSTMQHADKRRKLLLRAERRENG